MLVASPDYLARHGRPFAEACVKLVGRNVFGRHQSRCAPIAEEGIGISQVLAHFRGVVAAAQLRAGEGAILFFPDGGSTGGRVTLSAGTAAWSADVAWLTGETRLLRDEVRAP